MGRGETVLRIRIYIDFGWLDPDLIRLVDPVQKEKRPTKISVADLDPGSEIWDLVPF